MTVRLARVVYWLCTAWLIVVPVGAAWLLLDIDRFGVLAARTLGMPIEWHTVGYAQWYGLWLLSALYLAIGYLGVLHLRRAFASFANGQWFDTENSRSLRTFSLLLVAQGIARPTHFALSSLVLSLNHAPGDRVLSISVGSNEVILIVSGLILWVLSDLLVAGMRAQAENRQFV